MPARSSVRVAAGASPAFTLVEALLAVGVAAGALVLVSAGVGPLVRLAGEATSLAAADRAAEAVMAEDALQRSRGAPGLRGLVAGSGGGLPAEDGDAWWTDRGGFTVAAPAEWRAAGERFGDRWPTFAAIALVHRLGGDGTGPLRRSLIVGWPAVNGRGEPVPWAERRLRIWVGRLAP